MICFIGTSYAAVTLKEGARRRGLVLTDDPRKAGVIFISQDTPTDEHGQRQMGPIRVLIEQYADIAKTMVITSQVEPGFMTGLPFYKCAMYHQAETLRVEDGLQRAIHPEMFIVGSPAHGTLMAEYTRYLQAFDCPVFVMSYEEAAFAKIAINMTLAAQVDNTNRLAAAAAKCGADWGIVSRALRHDSRIGKFSYLTPGDWRKSRHLLRDEVTLKKIEALS